MATTRDRILLIENDPMMSDLIGRQALSSVGYQVQIVVDATAAIPKLKSFQPNAVILDLNLPGLSGKDMLVALNSQSSDIPVVLIAHKGMESDVIQGFRLGAADYLLWPARDTEVVSVVERVLRQVHERLERDRLSVQLQQTNQELQARVAELTTIFNLGKAVTSITNQSTLFNKIIEGACKVTNADLGWLTVREDNGKNFLLSAQRGLPPSLTGLMNQAWDDGISSLVAMSGETLSINGDPLKRFKVYSLGQSALIVPVKVKRQTVGIMVVMRKTVQPFTESEQHLLEAVADYASISLVNARLFRALEERAHTLQETAETIQATQKSRTELLEILIHELWNPLNDSGQYLALLLETQSSKLTPEQRQIVANAMNKAQLVGKIVELMASTNQPSSPKPAPTDVNEVVRQVAARYKQTAQQSGINLTVEVPKEPVLIEKEPLLLTQVLDGLVSNAFKFTQQGGQVHLRIDKTSEHHAHVLVRDTGVGIEKKVLEHIFDTPTRKNESLSKAPCGDGIPLVLVKRLITMIGGNIWVESKPGQGSAFHFTLRTSR